MQRSREKSSQLHVWSDQLESKSKIQTYWKPEVIISSKLPQIGKYPAGSIGCCNCQIVIKSTLKAPRIFTRMPFTPTSPSLFRASYSSCPPHFLSIPTITARCHSLISRPRNEINDISAAVGFQPSTVSPSLFHSWDFSIWRQVSCSAIKKRSTDKAEWAIGNNQKNGRSSNQLPQRPG